MTNKKRKNSGLIKMGVFLAIILVLFGTFAYLNNDLEINAEETETVPAFETSYTNTISPTDLQKKFESNEDVIVYFYKPTCTYCQKTTPIILPIVEKLGIDLSEYNLEDYPEGYEEFKIEGTPTLVHFKNGEEDNRLVGYDEDPSVFEEWFKIYQ